MTNWNSGISIVDEILNEPNCKFILLNGEKRHGKTALATQIALNLGRTGKVVKYYSLQHNNQELTFRILANVSGLHFSKIKSEKLCSENDLLIKAIVELAKAKIYINDEKSILLEDMIADITNQQKNIPSDLIIIDQMELIRTSSPEKHFDLYTIADALKNLSQTLNCPMIIIHTFSEKYLQNCFYTRSVPHFADWELSVELIKDQMLLTRRKSSYQPLYSKPYSWNKESLRIGAL